MLRVLPLLFLLTLLPSVAEKPRVAIVDAQRAFSAYYATRNAHQKLADAKLALQDDQRLPLIKATEEELEALQQRARDSELSANQREQAAKKAEMKAHELRSLQRDLQQFLDSEQKKMNALLVSATRKIQANVQSVIEQVAQAGKFDVVFESGGNTSSQVPTLLYVRDATDITDAVIKRLNSTNPNPPGDAEHAAEPVPPAPPE